MKKLVLALLAIMLLLSSCATKVEDPIMQTDKDGVPLWITRNIDTAEVHYERAYALQSNLQNSIRRAQADARALIAEWIEITVNGVLTTYTRDAGSDLNRQALDAMESISAQISGAILSGAHEEAMYQAEDGGVWILMSIPIDSVSRAIKDSDYKSIVNEPFEKNEAAEEASAMMDAALAKYFGI